MLTEDMGLTETRLSVEFSMGITLVPVKTKCSFSYALGNGTLTQQNYIFSCLGKEIHRMPASQDMEE
jgi:hypothetical protein